ncbi:globin domain-containing protein [Cumulibacter manganitolerans]|uniref:globin domain-containing protein n=1 Tax=Cumulibacter manganitolerans TaxID=1884992 RepID=UPI001294F9A0|nr:oxidoreductase [Cumulibacter manganitolerans]
MTGERSVYEAAGGAPGVLRLAEAWHRRVLADPIVAHAFRHHRADHTARLAAYLGEALGGPPTYTASLGTESEVVRLHAGNGPHEEMDARALAAWDAALTDCGLDADPRLAATLHAYWADGIRRMAEHHDPADHVPDGLRLETWTWDD